MLPHLLWIVLGFAVLIKGADWFVKGSSALARRLRVPDLVIGLTVVAFGTSAPELAVNVTGSIQGENGIVLGNVIGSNIFNILAILGVVGLVRPIRVVESTVWYEIPFTLVALVLVWTLARLGSADGVLALNRLDGSVLFLAFLGFLYYIRRSLKNENSPAIMDAAERLSVNRVVLLMIAGLGSLLWGGQLVVRHATELAQIWRVSSRIVGLTVVAVGTSLPELVTSLVAAWKKNSDIAIGNVLGSNIFNLLLVLSTSVLVRPLVVGPEVETDFVVLAVGTVALFLFMFIGGRRTLTRWEAAILLLSYMAYSVYLLVGM